MIRWAESRRSLATLLTDYDSRDPQNGVFRHPVAGWMTLGGVLDFFSVHITHHQFQLDRLNQAFEDRGS